MSDIETNSPDSLFNARISMALSSVMLSEYKRRRTPAQACAAGNFYLTKADEMIEYMKGKPLSLTEGQIERMHGFVKQIGARIDASCKSA
jgi:hypothetical protein